MKTTADAVPSLLVVLFLVAPVGASGGEHSRRPVQANRLHDFWKCSFQGQTTYLALLPSGVLSLHGAGTRYKLQGSTLKVFQDGTWVDYPFSLKGSGRKRKLRITVPGRGAFSCKPLPRGAQHQLSGLLCSYSGSSNYFAGTSFASSTRIMFDGKGRFRSKSESSFSAPEGQVYGGGGKEGGYYRVVGRRIFFVFDDGSGGIARVRMRQPDGGITEVMYEGTLFATQLCD